MNKIEHSDKIRDIVRSNLDLIYKFYNSDNCISQVEEISELVLISLKNGHTIFTCGNGGSMADALHFTAELIGRFKLERGALPSISLGSNLSSLSAIANDYGFDEIFSRELSAVGRTEDVLVVFSTSGGSSNIHKAIHVAKKIGMKTIAFLGASIPENVEMIDFPLHIPSYDTPRIQELHTLVFHTICEIIDSSLESSLDSSLKLQNKSMVSDEISK